MEPGVIPGDTLEQIERIGSTDVVIGVLGSDPEGEDDGAGRLVREAVGRLSGGARAVVIQNNGTPAGASHASDNPVEEERVRVLGCRLAGPDPAGTPRPPAQEFNR